MAGFDLALYILGCLVILGVFIYFYRKSRNLYIKLQVLTVENYAQNILLNNLANAWCYWYEGDSFLTCSVSLREILRFDLDQPLQTSDLCKILGESSFSPFQRALTHLSDFGGDFILQLPIFEETQFLEVKGRSVSCDSLPLRYSQSISKSRQMVILCFTDATEVVHEKGLYQAYQKEQDEEIEILRTLVDIAPLALWHRDQNGRIQYCNLAYSGALETTVHRVIAENRELIDSHYQTSTYDLSRKALESKRKQIIRTHLVVAGQRRFMEIAEIPIPGTHKTVGYAMDITEIEEAELELSLHINAHQEVLDQISAPIAIYGADTRIKFFNHAYRKTFELDEAWLYSRPTLGEILENLRERRFLPEYPNFLNHKRARLDLFKNLLYPIHEVLNQPNGQTLRLVIAPHPLGGLLYLFDDITDKLTLERGYNTLVAVQKETLDHLYEGIVVFGSDNRVRLSNPAMGRIWHLSDEKRAADLHINELLKNVAPLFSDPNESKLWRKRMMDIVSLRQSSHGQFRLDHDRMIEYSYIPLPDGSHLMSFVDVSDRWRFEQALQERTQTLERADRLKSDFISLVSYELKSPLNTIVGFIEILINQYFGQLNERQLDYCQGIADASDRLMNLINDMLDLANIEAGKLNLDFQEIQLDKFLNSLVDLVYNRAYDQGLELIIENTSSVKTIQGDTRRLKHALFNLLTNAIKFTPTGGKIILTVADDTERPGHIVIAVKDTGVGISPNDQERIFDLFQHGTMTQSNQMGAGLGLSLVRSLVELHGGFVSLASEANEGTMIACHLPITHSEA
ncbi:MAG: PAS domain-containing protein [Alphaproteobacteria bacterium]|jgi:PAS domain S-box-containing protein|nr:PAS domain-containing protein [Alphaproteobacteria bacterium]